ncbi:MAG: NAD(P)-dependent glycerol-3-phosphate dehydrogenase [Acidimicrobiia bacterium]|nr:NAD(P)-dependent glycerol-3-phosphate dehydrogenase [Acidimicrobiia bacterium]NNF10357.1 NAD(P)-dependent glycerol-3-phosphate dehydrogenase [Acidimicrobiia bacterium]NNL71529.1 NAD(P)-dependent glycerol-3-phosphate dehydrogenase [Acidimicrobiia bacterium]
MRVAVIGAGSWGTTVAALASQSAEVRLWSRRPELAEAINTTGRNPDYLAEYPLPEALRATADLGEALDGADAVVLGVPSHGLRAVLMQAGPQIEPAIPVISLTKGLEAGTNMRMTQVISDVLPDHDPAGIGVLTGPNLAREIMEGQPAASVISVPSEDIATVLQSVFMTPTLRVYSNTDVVGCEIAGSLKNVMALAAGMAHGLGYGDNSMATLITRALAELSRLGQAMGGNPATFAGLAGMGDLIATCVSPLSRNHRVGIALGEGRSLEEIISEMNMVAEGVKTTPVVVELARFHDVDMPIAFQVNEVLNGQPVGEMLTRLMGRPPKAEGE